MASKLKKRKRSIPPDPGRSDTMNYNEASKNPTWQNEIRWADQIMESNKRVGLDCFKLDDLTKGDSSHPTAKQKGGI